MKHYGDITKLSGYDLPIVDIVTGGSPCQDLSCAGKRKGLQHSALGDEETTRSGLFMEQIRVIKEMRDECERRLYDAGADYNRTDIKPRYMVWENVAGALSSGIPKGGDFRVVLEETAKIADKDAVIPGPPGGKWPYAGCIVSDGWSIAWRLHDAQYWGVPQRRKRICLLADFNGDTAGKVLFELQRETTNRDTEQAIVDIGTESRSEVQSVSKSLSRDIAQGGKEGERVAEDTERCTNPSSYTLKIRGGADTYRKPDGSIGTAGKGPLVQTELSGTLGVSQDQTLITVEQQKQIEDFVSGVNAEAKHQQDLIQSDLGVARTLAPGTHASGSHLTKTLVTSSINAGDNQQAVVYGIGSYDSNAMKSDNPHSGIYQADTSRTLDLNGGNPSCNQGGMAVVETIAFQGQAGAEASLQMGDDVSSTLSCTKQVMAVVYRGDSITSPINASNPMDMFVVQSNWDGSQVSPTLTANNANGSQRMPDKDNFNAVISAEVYHCTSENDKVQTLKTRDYKDPQVAAYGLDRASYNQGQNAQYNFSVDEEKVGTCVAKGPNAVCKAVDCLNGREKDVNGTLAANARKSLNSGNVVRCESVVRRLTPMECERLQGFPDDWTNIGDWVDSKGKTHKGESDSPRYKALGNSIALPYWSWMAERMMPYLPENPTMASLFDGISGFCLVFARAGCKPIFSSEIEEFPIAVAKKHFGDDERGIKGDYEKYL